MTDTKLPLWYLLRNNKDKFPSRLAAAFPHVVEIIAELWDDPDATAAYFTELLIPSRPNRKGFPSEIVAEIFALSATYDAIRRKEAEVSGDVWDSERAIDELERLGIQRTVNNFARAVEAGDQALCLLFISTGFDLESRDARDWTPLMIASFNGKESTALLLIQYGAKIDAQDRGGYTPMHWAAYSGYSKVIKVLVAEGGNVNVASRSGITPILQAAARGHVDTVRELIANGASVNIAAADGSTPLIKAVSNGHLAIVDLLLDSQALFDVAMKDGTTLIDMAMRTKDPLIRERIAAVATLGK